MATIELRQSINSDIRLVALRALLGMVPVSLRAFSVQLNENKVCLRSIFDESSSSSDIELLRMVGESVLAAYPGIDILEEDYWVISESSKMSHLEELIFLRHTTNLSRLRSI